ncbi:hypothetical protein KR222_007801 [Zaprionus bogoriensis]|nr:hypothetical protein KR222_007801 [Zaprionus bogoriensis]
MSGLTKNQVLPQLLLLLLIALGCLIASTWGQRLAVPTRQLLAPSVRFAESFETFDSVDAGEDDGDDMQRTRDQLRQLLGRQLTSAVAPLTAVPLAGLIRRQPGIVAPSSGAAAALRFATLPEVEEEESSEEDEESSSVETDTDADAGLDVVQQPVTLPVAVPVATPSPQPTPEPEYNPYRDNFQDRNEDGSYVFGYSLPNGVRRWERSFLSPQGRVVEGFYAQPRQAARGVEYELRCYRADAQGYHPLAGNNGLSDPQGISRLTSFLLAVLYLALPPRVRRYELPDVSCFNANRLRN